jgi:hypothetical protein
MVVWHPGEIQSTNEVIYTKCFHEALELGNAILWIPYDEAIIAKRV